MRSTTDLPDDRGVTVLRRADGSSVVLAPAVAASGLTLFGIWQAISPGSGGSA